MEIKEITLPSGATVKLRDPKSIIQKDRKNVYRAASGQEGFMQAIGLIDGLIAVLVLEWSFDLIIPSIKIEMLDELSIPDYDALQKEAEEAQKILFPQTSLTEETDKDPKALTDNFKD